MLLLFISVVIFKSQNALCDGLLSRIYTANKKIFVFVMLQEFSNYKKCRKYVLDLYVLKICLFLCVLLFPL